MTTSNEMYIDPNTGNYMDGADPAAYAADDQVMDMPAIELPAVEIAATTATVAPTCDNHVTRAYVREISTTNDSFDDANDLFKVDITLNVEVIDALTGKLVDSGIIVKKVKLSKAALGIELCSKTQCTQITEAAVESVKIVAEAKVTPKEGDTDAALRARKRLRELAGIPGKGNWV